MPTALRYLLTLTLPLYVIDQITKLSVVNSDIALNVESREVIPGFFWIVHVANTGIAFGNFNGGKYSNLIFGGIALVASVFIAWLWKRGAFPRVWDKVAASLLFAGIAGNVTDRILHSYVVDFLSFNLGFMMWPSFNVADACICVAAGLLFLSAFRPPPEKTDAKAS